MICSHHRRKCPLLSAVHLVNISSSQNYRIIWLIGTKNNILSSRQQIEKSPAIFPSLRKIIDLIFPVSLTIIHSVTQNWKLTVIFYSPYLSSPTQRHQVRVHSFNNASYYQSPLPPCKSKSPLSPRPGWLQWSFFLVNDLYMVSFIVKVMHAYYRQFGNFREIDRDYQLPIIPLTQFFLLIVLCVSNIVL